MNTDHHVRLLTRHLRQLAVNRGREPVTDRRPTERSRQWT